MQEAREKEEEEVTADTAHCVKGWLFPVLDEIRSLSDSRLDTLNKYLKGLVKARDALADGLRDGTISSLFHTLNGISADIDEFDRFNGNAHDCSARNLFQDHIVANANQSITEMEKLTSICLALSRRLLSRLSPEQCLIRRGVKAKESAQGREGKPESASSVDVQDSVSGWLLADTFQVCTKCFSRIRR